MRARVIWALAAAAALAGTPAASGHGVITKDGSALVYTTTNNCQPFPCAATLVVTTPETGVLEFEDKTSRGGIFWGPCDPITEERTRCDSSGVARIVVSLDHNNDSATLSTALPVQVNGGTGNDEITGSFGDDLLAGGPGTDTIVGGAGADAISGEAGDDVIDARDGIADTIDCGEGVDSAAVDAADPPAFGCETVLVEDTPPGGGPPDTPPDTTITRSPARETKREKARFRFTATEAGSTYECSRDGSPYRPCESPKRYGGLRPGRHLFKVRATDPAGNTDPTTAAYRWRVVG
jgi:hypothetical protein